MRFAITFFFSATFFCLSDCQAQNGYPSVADIMKQYDRDEDGFLIAAEVADSRYARQFPRWDKDQDGKVSSEDVIVFRRGFGIAADGSRLTSDKVFKIPSVEDLPRVDRDHRPTRQAAKECAYILRTDPHQVAGKQYVILTDHTTDGYLAPLQRLASYRKGVIVEVDDLASLHEDRDSLDEVREQLSQAKYVAIAPRKESFRENMLLGMWELLSTLDADAQIDVLPGLLVASNEEKFASFIDRSIAFAPLTSSDLQPLAISQVQSLSETRSLQKAGIIRKAFAQSGLQTPVVAIYGQQAAGAPTLPGDQVWNLTAPGNQKFVRTFPAPVSDAFEKSTLLILHGHGIPGMACSIDVDGLPDNLDGKILLSGSCFSAVPWQSDLPKMRDAPGGYRVQQRDAFSIRAIDQGAVVSFGHQRLSSGFPHLYPVLDAWTKGQTVGQAYQQLLNGLIDYYQTESGGFVITDEQKKQQRVPQNRLLYVIIGDPALQPMERLR